MHFEPGHADKETRAGEFFLLVMLAKNMTNVLTKKALDTLAEFLYAIHVKLGDFPFHAGARFERGDFPVDAVIPGNVGDKVLDSGKGFHGENGDGLVQREVVHAGLAGVGGTAVDFIGEGAALPCLPDPADRAVRRQEALIVLAGIESYP